MKISVGAKISFLMVLATLIVAATGYLSYKSISAIVKTIDTETRPDFKLEHIRKISTELEKGENSIRYFQLSNDRRALDPYIHVVNSVDHLIDTLRSESKDDPRMLNQVDTLNSLISQKIRVWREMLMTNDSAIINQYREIEQALTEESTGKKIDTILREFKKPDTTVVAVKEKPEKKGIFQKLFGKKDSEPKEEQVLQPQVSLPEPEIVIIEKTQEINKQDIQEKFNKLKELDSQKQLEIKEKELRLAQTSNEITRRLYRLIEQIERDEMDEKTGKSKKRRNQLATSTYDWLVLFSFSGIMLAILVLITIYRYTKKPKLRKKPLNILNPKPLNWPKPVNFLQPM
ncbi:MAG: hypothetical protein HC906_10290 [Bacteroidales bacterium]|nr:hypothetical protein [Bacteroidales bacterium]